MTLHFLFIQEVALSILSLLVLLRLQPCLLNASDPMLMLMDEYFKEDLSCLKRQEAVISHDAREVEILI